MHLPLSHTCIVVQEIEKAPFVYVTMIVFLLVHVHERRIFHDLPYRYLIDFPDSWTYAMQTTFLHPTRLLCAASSIFSSWTILLAVHTSFSFPGLPLRPSGIRAWIFHDSQLMDSCGISWPRDAHRRAECTTWSDHVTKPEVVEIRWERHERRPQRPGRRYNRWSLVVFGHSGHCSSNNTAITLSKVDTHNSRFETRHMMGSRPTSFRCLSVWSAQICQKFSRHFFKLLNLKS